MTDGNIIGLAAITEVRPDGQKVTACAVEYDCIIDNSRLTKNDFSVVDRFATPQYFNVAMCRGGGITDSPRTVIRIYANTEPDISAKGENGRYVIIELSPDDESAATVYLLGYEWSSLAHMKQICLHVTQNRAISTENGGVCLIPEWNIFNNRTINKVVDDFMQFEFKGLKYNLFIPENYDRTKSYPFVQFIADSWGLGSEHGISLAQGIGGIVWALPEEQAKHECFVVVPQFEGPRLCDDDWSVSEDLEKDIELLDHLMNEYSIDRNRVYTTGQSMGFLAGCELNIRYPDLFAASLMVSGFWNPNTMTALQDQNIWFFVSSGDTRAYENTSAAIDNIEASGTKVSRYYWNGNENKEILNAKARKAASEDCNIKYTIFDKDSTVPAAATVKNEATNHRGVWQLVYDLEAVRDWLFTNKRKPMK